MSQDLSQDRTFLLPLVTEDGFVESPRICFVPTGNKFLPRKWEFTINDDPSTEFDVRELPGVDARMRARLERGTPTLGEREAHYDLCAELILNAIARNQLAY